MSIRPTGTARRQADRRAGSSPALSPAAASAASSAIPFVAPYAAGTVRAALVVCVAFAASGGHAAGEPGTGDVGAFAAASAGDGAAAPPLAAGGPDPTERWARIRDELLDGRSIDTEERVVRLEVAGRAFDGARVPITVHAARGAPDEAAIERLHLVVDNNPVPVAATFTFEPGVGWNSIDTELRINEYSHVRAVAELADGSVDASARFVKAVGGCSAPPSSYERSDATSLGSFRGGLDEILNPRRPVSARIRLVHPNASGMQFDQFTRTYIPPHYVHTMGAAFDGEPLFTLATNFSLSQDPVLGFDFRAPGSGTLSLYAVDSKGRRFEKAWPLEVAPAAGD